MISYKNISNNYFLIGLSTDEKPIDGITNGTAYLEMDTGTVYVLDAENARWLELGGDTPTPPEPPVDPTEIGFKHTITANCYYPVWDSESQGNIWSDNTISLNIIAYLPTEQPIQSPIDLNDYYLSFCNKFKVIYSYTFDDDTEDYGHMVGTDTNVVDIANILQENDDFIIGLGNSIFINELENSCSIFKIESLTDSVK